MSQANPQPTPNTPRRPTNVTLPSELVEEAKRLDINISKACEGGLLAAVASLRRTRWLEENRDATQAYNNRIEATGPTLAAYRRF